MKSYITVCVSMLCALSSYGQIETYDLLGKWFTENNDSLYYKSKYVRLYSDSAFIYKSGHCNFIEWKIEPSRLTISKLNKCIDAEDWRVFMTMPQRNIVLRKVKRKQFIELTHDGSTYEKFLIMEFKKSTVNNSLQEFKLLKLKRV